MTLAASQPALDAGALLRPLSLALDRRRAYGPMHPVAGEAAAQLHDALARYLVGEPRLALQVVRDELLVDGTPLATGTVLARELATRFGRRGIGAIVFDGPPSREALHALLGFLGGEDDAAVETNGPPVTWSRDGIVVTPLRYDQLVVGETSDERAEATLKRCLGALARLAGVEGIEAGLRDGGAVPSGGLGAATGAPGGTGAASDPLQRLAPLLLGPAAGRAPAALQTARILGALAETAIGAPSDVRDTLAAGLGDILERIGPAACHAMIAALDSGTERRTLLSRLAGALPADAIGGWLQVVASATGHEFPPQLVQLVNRLADAEGPLVHDAAERALRDAAAALVTGWTVADPNPAQHRLLLERIAAHEGTSAAAERADPCPAATNREPVEDSRIVSLALELDVVTPSVHDAVRAMLERGEFVPLLTLLRRPSGGRAAATLRRTVLDDGAIERFVLAPDADAGEVEDVLALFGSEAVPLLVELLARAPRRETRRLLLARLRHIGPDVAPLLEPLVATAQPSLARNLLLLLRDFGATSPGVVQAALRRQDDPNAGVRAEALRFLAGVEAARGRAILRGLRDPAQRVVRVALAAVADHAASLRLGEAPGYDVHTLVDGLIAISAATTVDERTQAAAVLAAGAIGGARVRDWLATLLVRRTRILRRRALAHPTAVTIAAYHVLHRQWRRDPVVADVLGIAERGARDPRWQEVPALPTEEERP